MWGFRGEEDEFELKGRRSPQRAGPLNRGFYDIVNDLGRQAILQDSANQPCFWAEAWSRPIGPTGNRLKIRGWKDRMPALRMTLSFRAASGCDLGIPRA